MQATLILKCLPIIFMYWEVYIIDYGKHNKRLEGKFQCLDFFVPKFQPKIEEFCETAMKWKLDLKVSGLSSSQASPIELMSTCEVCNSEIIQQVKIYQPRIWGCLEISCPLGSWSSQTIPIWSNPTGPRCATFLIWCLFYHQNSATQTDVAIWFPYVIGPGPIALGDSV